MKKLSLTLAIILLVACIGIVALSLIMRLEIIFYIALAATVAMLIITITKLINIIKSKLQEQKMQKTPKKLEQKENQTKTCDNNDQAENIHNGFRLKISKKMVTICVASVIAIVLLLVGISQCNGSKRGNIERVSINGKTYYNVYIYEVDNIECSASNDPNNIDWSTYKYYISTYLEHEEVEYYHISRVDRHPKI